MKSRNNYAYIDSQNLHLGIKAQGWDLDYKKFRIYLREKYSVRRAFLFMGFLEKHASLYKALTLSGYEIIFKPIVPDIQGAIKGNVDADLVLHTVLDIHKYDKAVIVSGDGDFYSLVDHLHRSKKLAAVLSPHPKYCSSLLKISAKEYLHFMDNLYYKLKYIK